MENSIRKLFSIILEKIGFPKQNILFLKATISRRLGRVCLLMSYNKKMRACLFHITFCPIVIWVRALRPKLIIDRWINLWKKINNMEPILTLRVPIPDEEKKFSYIFIFTLLCGPSVGFIKTLKAFIKPFDIKPFEAPQWSMKIKI